MYLEKIKCPGDIKKLNTEQLNILCAEIREKLVDVISKNGGHLASNLGVVELTVRIFFFCFRLYEYISRCPGSVVCKVL